MVAARTGYDGGGSGDQVRRPGGGAKEVGRGWLLAYPSQTKPNGVGLGWIGSARPKIPLSCLNQRHPDPRAGKVWHNPINCRMVPNRRCRTVPNRVVTARAGRLPPLTKTYACRIQNTVHVHARWMDHDFRRVDASQRDSLGSSDSRTVRINVTVSVVTQIVIADDVGQFKLGWIL